MFDLRHQRNLEGWIEQPAKSKHDGQRNYKFILGGYVLLFTVSKQQPRISAREFCLKPSGEMMILIEDEAKILRPWIRALRRARRI